jgi:hypothetical protein
MGGHDMVLQSLRWKPALWQEYTPMIFNTQLKNSTRRSL